MPNGRRRLEEVIDAPPLMAGGHTLASVTDKIVRMVLDHPHSLLWKAAMGPVTLLLVGGLLCGLGLVLFRGVGMWGIDIPVAWGFAILSYVWWIAIGMAGTLTSTTLLLAHGEWRNSINRIAETMTLFAVTCSGIYPLFHLGRPWVFYWLMPYPNDLSLWPQFRSPLVWDFFAVAIYLTCSIIFWYVALIPDLACVRDQATGRVKRFLYGVFSMGWRNSARHWHNLEVSYLLMAGLITPLVVSVHTEVSYDYAIGITPGWHETIFPPYFVAGAVFSGICMLINLAVPIRAVFGLEDLITLRHLDYMAKLVLATGMIVDYTYMFEGFMSWYSADTYNQYVYFNYMHGPYAGVFWLVMWANIVVPQLYWFKRIRRNPMATWCVAIVIQVGMWMERYFLTIPPLSRDFLPRSWGMYSGRFVDWMVLFGTFGFFLWGVFLCLRYIPIIPIYESRQVVHKAMQEAGRARVET